MDQLTIRLREWESVSPDPGSLTHGRFLPPDPSLRALSARLAREGILEIQELRPGLHLKATSFVGCLNLGELRIVIEPKIQGMPLMALLRYAYGLRDLHLSARVTSAIGDSPFQDLLIRQLLAEWQDLVSRGLYRRYEPVLARLGTPRGRLDIQALARDNRITTELPCRYHPKVEDCLQNQVLLAGLRLAAQLTEDRDLRTELSRAAASLESQVSAIPLSPESLDRLRRQIDRLSSAYEPAISLIEILLLSSGTSLQGAPKEAKLPGFFFDMNRFFQRLLGRFLRENLPDCLVQEESSIKGMMCYAADHNPKARRAPSPRPDYKVTVANGATLLLDAKYRDLWSATLPRDMLYQLAIYALSQKPRGRATILYPTVDPAARDSVVHIFDPGAGIPCADVVQRPVNLLDLAALLPPGPAAQEKRRRHAFATRMLMAPA